MTPKEKAEELVKKMYAVRSGSVSMITLHFAKQCALIAVDEILKDREEIDGMRVINDPYWSKVKQEINSYGESN
jgi:hypothetical protein